MPSAPQWLTSRYKALLVGAALAILAVIAIYSLMTDTSEEPRPSVATSPATSDTVSSDEKDPMIRTLHVNSELVDCVGVGPRKCLEVREDPADDWELFYDDIEGFTFESGFRYTLRIKVEEVDNPPADASSLRYELIEVVDKTPA